MKIDLVLVNISNKICFYLLALTGILLLYSFNKSLELSDESFYLLMSIYPSAEIGKLTNFGYMNNFLLNTFGFKLYNLRLLGFILLFLSNFYFIKKFFNFIDDKVEKKYTDFYNLCIVTFFGTFSYYYLWLPTPSYNLYNLCSILIFFGTILDLWKTVNFKKYLYTSFILVVSGFFCFISKVSSSLILIIVYFGFIFFISNLTKKEKTIIIFGNLLLSLIIFSIFVHIFYTSFENFFNDIFLGSKIFAERDPNYSFKKLLIWPLNQIVYFLIITNYKVIIFSSFIFLIIHNKRNKDLVIFIYTMLMLLILREPILALFTLISYMLIFKKNIITKNVIYFSILIMLLSFAFSFGTNTNFIRHLKYINIFFFILIFFLFIQIQIKKNLLTGFFLISLTIYSITTFIVAMQNPYRLPANIYNQNKIIKVPQFNDELLVDERTQKYVENLQNLTTQNGWEVGNYVMDFTGRSPGINIILGGKFISKPWYLSGYIYSNDYVEKILIMSPKVRINKSWIITSDGNPKINPNVLHAVGLDINKGFTLIGKIEGLLFSEKNKYYHYIWKPKKH